MASQDKCEYEQARDLLRQMNTLAKTILPVLEELEQETAIEEQLNALGYTTHLDVSRNRHRLVSLESLAEE